MDPQLRSQSVLIDPLNLRNISTTGSTFSVAQLDETNDNGEEDVEKPQVSELEGVCCTTVDRFSELALKMDDVVMLNEGYIKKQLISSGGGHLVPENAIIKVYYAGFWEMEKYPFDWKLKGRPKILNLGQNEVLPGLEYAISTMEFGEKSIFLLSHHLMYGDRGCPPRIRAKEPCLFFIHALGLADPKLLEQSEEVGSMFSWSFKTANQYHVIGKDLFQKQNYKYAAQVFSKAAHILQKTNLADEKEEEKQRVLLTTMYLNMAVCYNKLNLPKRACLACNNLHRLSRLWNNPKALFQNARALIMIEEYADAEKRLKKALALKPNNKDIMAEMNSLNIKMDKQRQRESNIKTVSIQHLDRQTVSQEFIETVTSICEKFSIDPEASRMSLPIGLNEAELVAVREIGEKFGFIFSQVTPEDKLHLDKDIDDDRD